jgi:Tfp pilus assembly protein PilZ
MGGGSGREPGNGLAQRGPARFAWCVPAGAEQGAVGLGMNPPDKWGRERERERAETNAWGAQWLRG